MYASMFKHQVDHRHDLIKDFIRLIRDGLALLNDLMNSALIEYVVNYLNHMVGDYQNPELGLNP